VTACPSPEQLRRLLAGALEADEFAGLEAHVEKCPACQQMLEHLTDDAALHPAAPGGLSADRPTCDMGGAEAAHPPRGGPATVCFEREAAEPPALEFLTPPGRADSLGRLGHYEVLEILGRGGFGIVLRSFDEALQRVVAIKVLAPQMAATSPARKRFLREARSAAQVRHENVVQIYAIEEEPLPYLVMEYVPGESLQQRLDRVGPLEAAEVVSIGRQVADGLAAAHVAGLIHRDVKPSNVLLESGPRLKVKVTDFGLARAADDASITQSGVVAGTPQYMSPEQAQGEKLDPRTDLFSLGSVLYAITAGHPPFRAGNTLAVLKRVVEETPRSIPEIIPETPAWLCRVIARLMEKDLSNRFQTAQEVGQALAAGPTSPATVAPAVRQMPRKASPRMLLAGAVLALVGVLALTAYWLTRPGPNAGQNVPSPDGNGNQTRNENPAPQLLGLPTPEELANRPAPADALKRADIPADLLTEAGGGDPDKAAPEIVAILKGHERGNVLSVAFSPDGQMLASAGDDTTVCLWDLANGQLLRTLTGHQRAIRCVAFHQDGRRLASGSEDGTVRLWDTATGEGDILCKGPNLNFNGVAFSADGKTLALATQVDRNGGSMVLWDMVTRDVRLPPLPIPGAWCVAISPDGKSVVAGGNGAVLRRWDTATGQTLADWRDEKALQVRCVSFHPAGRLLATTRFGTQDGSISLWNLDNLRDVRRLEGHPGGILCCAWRADGRLLVSVGAADDTVRLWDLGGAEPRFRRIPLFPPGTRANVHCVALSPEGRYLATAHPNGMVYVLRLAGRGQVLRFPK
jgi:WD40 repeat protein